jgi:hypothetical protein
MPGTPLKPALSVKPVPEVMIGTRTVTTPTTSSTEAGPPRGAGAQAAGPASGSRRGSDRCNWSPAETIILAEVRRDHDQYFYRTKGSITTKVPPKHLAPVWERIFDNFVRRCQRMCIKQIGREKSVDDLRSRLNALKKEVEGVYKSFRSGSGRTTDVSEKFTAKYGSDSDLLNVSLRLVL